MTRKEIQTIIDEHPNLELYLHYKGSIVETHMRISKTALLRNAKRIDFVRYATYGEERPDLKRYKDRITGWNDLIVTFYTKELSHAS